MYPRLSWSSSSPRSFLTNRCCPKRSARMAEYTVWVYDQLDYSILPLHGVGNFGALHDRADFP